MSDWENEMLGLEADEPKKPKKETKTNKDVDKTSRSDGQKKLKSDLKIHKDKIDELTKNIASLERVIANREEEIEKQKSLNFRIAEDLRRATEEKKRSEMKAKLEIDTPTFIELMQWLKENQSSDPTGVMKRLFKYAMTGNKNWKKIVEDTLQILIVYKKSKRRM